MLLSPARLLVVLVVLALVLMGLPPRNGYSHFRGPSEGRGNGKNLRVGLVFDVGGRGDKSFNDAAWAGLDRARKELGVAIECIEPVGSEDREAGLRLFASRGFDLILGVGFIFSTDVDVVAKDYPQVKFACVDYAPTGSTIPPNVAGLTFREEEGAFLVGAVAGMLSKSGHVGFVGGMENPLIRKFEAGYEHGAKTVCPKCVVHGAYAGSTPEAFRDPAKGKALAISHIASGADVLFHASGSTGHGVFEGARDGHALAIGVDADQYDEMPGTVVTSMIKRGDVVVFETIKAVQAQTFRGGLQVYGIKEGAIDFVHDGPHAAGIPESVKQRVFELRDAIQSERLRVHSR